MSNYHLVIIISTAFGFCGKPAEVVRLQTTPGESETSLAAALQSPDSLEPSEATPEPTDPDLVLSESDTNEPVTTAVLAKP